MVKSLRSVVGAALSGGAQQARSLLTRPLRDRIDQRVRDELEYLVPQLVEFHCSPRELRQSFHDHTRGPLEDVVAYHDRVREQLVRVGIPVEEIDLDIPAFNEWMRAFPEMTRYYERGGDVRIEKCLEHFIAWHRLGIGTGDRYIDMAASQSPWADALRARSIDAYSLDLSYPPGIHGHRIGGDASRTGLPTAFASALSLQCAFETFMGPADVEFFPEASRLLNEHGRLLISPLYVDETHFNLTSPFRDQRPVVLDEGAKRVWREGCYKERFSRHYSAEAFSRRVWSHVPGDMDARVLFVRNLPAVAREYPGQRVYCFFAVEAWKHRARRPMRSS